MSFAALRQNKNENILGDGMSETQRGTADDHIIDKISHDRYLRTGRSSRNRMKILVLGVALGVTLLVLLVVSIYSAAKILSLGGEKVDLERKLIPAEQEVQSLKPQLEQPRSELNDLVQSRFPNLQQFEINNMLEINEGLIKQVVFTKIKRGKQDVYKYLVVADNAAVKKINPSFRVLLFDTTPKHFHIEDLSVQYNTNSN